MWKASAASGAKLQVDDGDDDWETDPDFVNEQTEEEQRWGSKTVEGSGRQDTFSMGQLRGNVVEDHAVKSEKVSPRLEQ